VVGGGGVPERTDPAVRALEGMDRLLEQRVRLGICVLLARSGRITFSRLKELLGETDGNLGANLQRLEEAQYVKVTKVFADRRPASWYALTAGGRKALDRHLAALAALTDHAR